MKQSTTKQATDSMKERLRERVRLCFFSNICNTQSVTETRQPRVISAATTKTPQKQKPKTKNRSDQIRAQIQAKAKACFFEGKCN